MHNSHKTLKAITRGREGERERERERQTWIELKRNCWTIFNIPQFDCKANSLKVSLTNPIKLPLNCSLRKKNEVSQKLPEKSLKSRVQGRRTVVLWRIAWPCIGAWPHARSCIPAVKQCVASPSAGRPYDLAALLCHLQRIFSWLPDFARPLFFLVFISKPVLSIKTQRFLLKVR